MDPKSPHGVIAAYEKDGSKEIDILLGNFVKSHIDSLNDKELYNLLEILLIEDEVLRRWYFSGDNNKNVPDNKIFSNIHKYGNTTAASIGIALSEALDEQLIKDGDIIVLASFGAGWYWGSVIIKW